MRKSIKHVLKGAAFFLGLAVILAAVSGIFQPKNNTAEDGMREVKANGILGEREHSVDVLVLGDSESFSAISPMNMWKEYGITAYVCGTSGQPLYLSQKFLKQAFLKQRPAVVILETDNIYGKIKLSDALAQPFYELFPVLEYHDRWKSLKASDFLERPSYTGTDECKGYFYSAAVAPADSAGYMAPDDGVEKIPARNKRYVKRIAEFCQANGAEFLLVSTPSTKNWNYRRHNGIQKLAEKYGLAYIDMNLMTEQVPINWQTDTRDQGDHLNHAGAIKVSRYLGSYLTERYGLTDHRNDPAYGDWSRAAEKFTAATGG